MAIVKVTEKMVAEAIAATDWAAIDAMTDEDIARQIEENPDAAPDLSKPRNRRLFRVLSKRLPPHYRVKLLRRSLRLTRAEGLGRRATWLQRTGKSWGERLCSKAHGFPSTIVPRCWPMAIAGGS
jgi:hypothetical protein